MSLTAFLKHLAFVAVVQTFMVVGYVSAQPTISVTSLGVNDDGNLEWSVDMAPDTSLFIDGEGALATELGFEFTGSTLLETSVNDAVWMFELPGFNPFTETITTGIAASDTQAFVSLGSDPVSDAVQLLTFTTLGSATTTVAWGDYEIPFGAGFSGGRISQGGTNFDQIIGIASSESGLGECDPNTLGDVNGSGSVDFADFLILSGSFGVTAASHEEGDIDCSGRVDFADFLVLSENFGQTVAGSAAVPEPTSRWILFVGLLSFLSARCHWTLSSPRLVK